MKKCSHHSCNRTARDGRTTCARHGEQSANRSAKWGAKKRAAGLCWCGQVPTQGLVSCERCRNRRKENAIIRQASGVCLKCSSPAAAGRKYCEVHYERGKLLAAARVRATKEKVLNHYGWRCVCCGETEFEFLTLDHINNDGAEHRRQMYKTGVKDGKMYKWLIKNGFPPIVQTMCMNCNWAKGRYGECPHAKLRMLSLVI